MKINALTVLRFFLWFSCAFHLIVGIGLNVSPTFPQLMAGYYGDPLKNAAIVYALVALLAIRGLQRFVFQDAIVDGFVIDPTRNVVNGIVFLLLAASFAVLFKLAKHEKSTIY